MTNHSRFMLKLYLVLTALMVLWMFALAARGGETYVFNPRSAVFGFGGAKGDGKTDDTRAVQLAIDKMRDRGGHVRVTPGLYLVDLLVVSGDKDFEIYMEPGAWLIQKPVAAGTLEIACKTDARTRKVLRNIAIKGTLLGDPASVGTKFGVRAKGIPGDPLVNGAHGLSIYDARIERVDGAGIELTHTYGANVYGGWYQWNGVGIKCDGANGVNFYGPVLRYNYVGAIDPQNLFGGIVEGSMADGIRLLGNVVRYNFHNVYFEQNALRYPGADIANGNDPATWHPVAASIDGCFFASAYDAQQRPNYAAHNFKGDFYLSTSGVTRFFNGTPRASWAQFDIRGLVLDNAWTNPMSEVPGGFGQRVTNGELTVRQPSGDGAKIAALEKRIRILEEKP
jgi:hypothetical protein